MDDQLKEWAETRAIKQTKLPKKNWIKQPDGTSRALVELVRDKDGCVVRIEAVSRLPNHTEQPLEMVAKQQMQNCTNHGECFGGKCIY